MDSNDSQSAAFAATAALADIQRLILWCDTLGDARGYVLHQLELAGFRELPYEIQRTCVAVWLANHVRDLAFKSALQPTA